jgi:hypothetical protein
MLEGKGEKNGTDNWSFGRSRFGVCDSLFSSANLRKACEIVYGTPSMLQVFWGMTTFAGVVWLSSLHADNQARCIDAS